jgi:hypothetical protein
MRNLQSAIQNPQSEIDSGAPERSTIRNPQSAIRNPQSPVRRSAACLLALACLVGCEEEKKEPRGPVVLPSEQPARVFAARKEPLPAGAVLYLAFDMETMCLDNDRPYIKDLSGRANGGRVKDAQPAKGRFGTALSFDGKLSRVAGNDAMLPANASPVSISLWFLARKPGLQTLFCYGTPNSPASREMTLLDPPGLSFFRHGGKEDQCQIENVPISLNEWHHFVCTYDDVKRTVTFYLDGQNKGTSPGYFFTARSGYFIGGGGNNERSFDGLIDDLIVFNRVLPPGDVQALFQRKVYDEAAPLSFDSLNECR